MNPRILISVLALSLVFPAISEAKKKDIPKNVQLAAKAMRAASLMTPNKDSHSVQHSGKGACWWGKFKTATACKAWYRDFAEDLNYFVVLKDNVVYIAFKGTDGARNDKMNKNAHPINRDKLTLHRGWWEAKNKSWRKIHPFLKKYAKGRKIIITGHSMGGALAAYTAKKMMDHPAYKNNQIRLVTFGAPRYNRNSGRKFFPYRENMYIYAMENKYKKLGIWHTDAVVKAWAGRKMKDKWKHIWYAACKTKMKNQDDVHNSYQYYINGKADSCTI